MVVGPHSTEDAAVSEHGRFRSHSIDWGAVTLKCKVIDFLLLTLLHLLRYIQTHSTNTYLVLWEVGFWYA